ncbi:MULTISPECIES: DUF2057 domain-containing protein [unclassified Acinetobacter]|uniref:YccT family protein n=1 Tax=unclassified Acinetobacter TaxID=196816 RepID=UPI0018AA85DF|nr:MULTISPECIES: DUF2057 domain-containing protein [unclassified Acinetobacter]MBJ9954250.1 DUF2057 domain-containing protein [Acinetobacter baumannii]
MAFKYGIAALSLMLSGSVFAAVTLSAPEEIVVLAVNDQEVNSGLIRKKNEYQVDPGQTAVSVRYQQYFEHLNGEHDILKSGVVTITAPDLKDGQNYKLALVGAPKNFDDAKKYAEQPTIAILDNNNRLVVQQTGANTEAKPWFGSGVFGRVIDLTSSKKTPVNQPAPVYAAPSQAAVSNTAQKSVPAVANGNAADQQLIQIWQKASKAERQKFMTWLADQ